MKNAAYQRLSRTLKLLSARSTGFEDIANPANGVDHLLRKIPVHFVAQPADHHVHHVGLWIEAVIPNVLENQRLGNYFARVAQEIFEQRKLARLQIEVLTGARDFAGDQVHAQISGGERRWLG